MSEPLALPVKSSLSWENMLAGLALTLTVLLTACAEVAQEVTFTSDPPGATVLVGTLHATTPATLGLPLDADQRVRFELDGYETVEFTLEREVAWNSGTKYNSDRWYGRIWTGTELDILLIPFRLLVVGHLWAFYPEIHAILTPKKKGS